MNGDRIAGALARLEEEYEIVRELGRGGTALVYLARERATGNEVAIKLIRAKYVEDEEALARFAREARYVAQLNHPNVVALRSVVDLGDAGVALIMAHVAGRTLKQVIQEDGPVSPDRAERVLRDVAAALGAAHAMGIVHRDVKPENIFIDAQGRALLADFGVARSMTSETQLTMSGVAIGTPAYMAPEQIEGGDLDGRGDIYSLGLVAWEMLTGKRPWDGASLYAVLYNQKHEYLPDVREMRSGVPDRIADVIAGAIEKDRNARWQTVQELVAGLEGSAPVRRTPAPPRVNVDTVRFARPTVDVASPPKRASIIPIVPTPPLVPAIRGAQDVAIESAEEPESVGSVLAGVTKEKQSRLVSSRLRWAVVAGATAVGIVAIALLAGSPATEVRGRNPSAKGCVPFNRIRRAAGRSRQSRHLAA